MNFIPFALLAWLLLPPGLCLLLWRCHHRSRRTAQERDALKRRFSNVISLEMEMERLETEEDNAQSTLRALQRDYRDKKAIYDRLKHEIAAFDEQIAFAEMGVYEPHFDFGDAQSYKDEIKAVRARQKEMISQKTAAICPSGWTVDGSRAKGATMVNRQMRLTLRAFNNEAEAAIANTRWNNGLAMEKRVLNAAKQIDAANASMNMVLNDDYIALKIDELHLTHEYREQLKADKDERAHRARLEREEKKLQAEADKAAREEAKYLTMLEKARQGVGADAARIAELEAALEQAHATAERAKSLAQMTKSGYVYVVSNLGSFGPDIVKIGLTRRLDPEDRVRELGDASVPFRFDTHAMIYSDQAPALETALHKRFHDKRVNASNMRKEFFEVSLQEVRDAVQELAPQAAFFEDREAQEWHETLARRSDVLASSQSAPALPAAI